MPAESIYVKRAQHYLNDSVSGRTVEMINAGVGDIGIQEMIDILRETGLLVQPDRVGIAFYLNDSRPPWNIPQDGGIPEWFLGHSGLAQAIYRVLRTRNWVENHDAKTLE